MHAEVRTRAFSTFVGTLHLETIQFVAKLEPVIVFYGSSIGLAIGLVKKVGDNDKRSSRVRAPGDALVRSAISVHNAARWNVDILPSHKGWEEKAPRLLGFHNNLSNCTNCC